MYSENETSPVDTHFSLKEAQELVRNNKPKEDDPIDTSQTFKFVAAPSGLRNEMALLAELYLKGDLQKTEVTLTLKKWADQLKNVRSGGVDLASLKEDFEAAMAKLKAAEPSVETAQRPELKPEEREQAIQLGQMDLAAEFKKALSTLGYVASDVTTLALMHTIYSRLLNGKMGWLHYGRSRSGKSDGLEQAFKLLNPHNRMRATSMTSGATFSLGHLDHIFILGGELKIVRPGEDDSFQHVLRQFLSEAEIAHIRLEETTGKAKRYERTVHTVSGFASIAWTSTKEPQNLNDEFALRLTSVPSNDEPEVTAEVQSLMAMREKDPKGVRALEAQEIKRWNDFDLSLEPADVIISFADRIKLRNDDTTARGIFKLLLNHTKISALYNQHKRQKTKDGCLVATLEDYKAAYSLVDLGAFRVFDALSNAARQAYKEARELLDQDGDSELEISQSDIIDALKRPKSTVQDWLRQWIKADVLVEIEKRGERGRKLYQFLDREDSEIPGLGLVPLEELLGLSADRQQPETHFLKEIAAPEQVSASSGESAQKVAESAGRHPAARKPKYEPFVAVADGADSFRAQFSDLDLD